MHTHKINGMRNHILQESLPGDSGMISFFLLNLIIVLNVQKQFDQYSCQVPVLVSETIPSTPAECKSSQPVERVSYLLLD